MSSINNEYANLMNQQKVANSNAMFGTGNNLNIGGGISGDMLQQWVMLGANSSAYKKLQEMQKTGTIRGAHDNQIILNSDRYYNDNFDVETGKLKKATYKPVASATPELDKEATSGDHLQDMRTLALAAITNPKNMTQAHYDMFEKMRQNIASNFVTSKDESTEVESGAATAAKVEAADKYRLLVDDQKFTVAGAKGEKTYTFGLGTSLEDIAAKINADSDATGVTASAVTKEDGTVTIELASVETGKDAFVRVDQSVGDLFAAAGSSNSAKGTDATSSKTETVASGEDTQAAMLAGVPYGKIFEDIGFTLQGSKGQMRFEFGQDSSLEDIAAAINETTEKTGVKAEIIYNDLGDPEGIGLLADKAGSGHYVQVTQDKGSLFTTEGRTVSVAGSSKGKDGGSGQPTIGKLTDLGQVTVGGEVYSFADLAPGGKASLAENPDAALAVLDQAIKEIYSGLAQVKGFDPKDTFIPGVTDTSKGAHSSNNTMEFQNHGSDALTNWINKYIRD